MKIKELLLYGINLLNENNIEDGNLISNLLLQKVLNVGKTDLVVKENEEVTLSFENNYKLFLEKIIKGVPLQYITNQQYFYGYKFFVDENVLIPQPDTEILVEEVIKKYSNVENLKILDMCTGSGCIGITLKKKLNNAFVTLTDISDLALEVASKNAKDNDIEVKIIKSDMFENIDKKYDVIVSNPPYIKTNIIKDLSKDVQNEPYIALDGGEDGLKFYKIFALNAYKYLNKEGCLFLEIGYDQKEEVIDLFKVTNKYGKIECIKDLSGNDRVIVVKGK